jgi:hypothetical protein
LNAALTCFFALEQLDIERVTERAGGAAALQRVLHDHGVSIDGPPEDAIRAWLDAERTRHGVQIVDGDCG